MTPEQEERLVGAFEMLTHALEAIASVMHQTFMKTYPIRPQPRDIEITKPLTVEAKLRTSQGATGEATTEEWMDLSDDEEEIGWRTKEFLEREKARRRKEAAAQERPPGPAD